MASIRSRLQIPRLISPKKSLQYGSGNCGTPPPPPSPAEPCRGCPSKCLEKGYGKPIKRPRKKLFSFRKEPVEIKEKPSNCVKDPPKPVEVKLAWWEQIFGPDPKRSWPDPCTCRVAHRQKRKIRSQDLRLDDPRYKETAGDVFLYTEQLKQHKRPCTEPQPKPPPGFKVPKAVLYKMMVQDPVGRMSTDNAFGNEMQDCCKSSAVKMYRIPYEEMRPLEKRRKAFSCREGIQTQDVPKPFSADLNLYRVPSLAQQFQSTKNYKCRETIKKPAENMHDLSDLMPKPQKRSRIEQLKILLQQKDTFHCIASAS